jgi:hypothetical protein
MRLLIIITFLILTIILQVSASDSTYSIQDTIFAFRLNENIKIDGKLSEVAWLSNNGVSAFIQRDPLEGAKPTFPTIVYILYDDQAIYVGARMYDSAPDSIISRLSRRDANLDSDAFGVFIDPYLDRRSGYYFGLTAAGTFIDGVLLNDDWDDSSWDGVWEGEVNIDDNGWTAELRIPYSQLRFQQKNKYEWGINFRRDIKRRNEKNYLVFTPKNGSGFVSRFPLLCGINNIKPGRTMEMLPYVRGKAEFLDVLPGNPYNDGSRFVTGFGTDFKYGISNNLTLDGTINPDFGQVEVDPAVVNLSDVETYFQERRPFFIEGASIFNFGYGGSRSNWGFNWGNPDFFYSRRIGRTPGGSLPDYDYANIPDGTRILGAGKLTGKVWGNWNLGTIHAITNREYADLSIDGQLSKTEVEPLTYYGVLRAQNEIDKGMQGIGFITTLVNRNFNDHSLRDEMNTNAFNFGIDGWTFLDKDKMWVTTFWTGMSNIRANTNQMLNMQTSSQHYFQRPDANHVNVDSSATSLTGYAGRILLNKQKGNIIFNSALGFIDPKFNVNDAGFMWRNDVINGHIGSGYKWTDPGVFTRQTQLIFALFGSLDFGHNVIWAGFFADAFFQFLNYYSIDIMYAYNPETKNNRLTRGGPLTISPPGWELNIQAQSDDRKPLTVGVSTGGYTRSSNDWYRRFNISLDWKPVPNLMLSFTPGISWDQEETQWIDVFSDPTATHTYQNRYVFGEMSQVEFSASIRLNWTFTPKISFQLYAQPLVSKAEFKNFKELARPSSYDFNRYGEDGSTIEYDDGEYIVDPDGPGPTEPFSFADPNFNIKSLRLNAVFRWEYLPGSTLYLVWTQSRYNDNYQSDFQFHDAAQILWNENSDNIFMIKLTYWLHL